MEFNNAHRTNIATSPQFTQKGWFGVSLCPSGLGRVELIADLLDVSGGIVQRDSTKYH